MGLLDNMTDGVAGAGVMLDSMHQYQRRAQLEKQADISTEQEQHAAANRNTQSDIATQAMQREEANAAEDRAAAGAWKDGLHADMAAASAAKAAPQPVPTQAVQNQPVPGQAASDVPPPANADEGGAAMPASAGNVPATALPQPTDQPPPHPDISGAVPGETLQASPVTQSQAPTTPGGNPQLAKPQISAQPGQQSPPQPGSAQQPVPAGRMGFYESRAQYWESKGEFARADRYRQQAATTEKEGFGIAAHRAMMNPYDYAGITQGFNSTGALKIIPGTLAALDAQGNPITIGADGKPSAPATGNYTASILDANGQIVKVTHNILQDAINLGVIAPPTMKDHAAGSTITTQDAQGNIKVLREGETWKGVPGRDGMPGYEINSQNGDIRILSADGQPKVLTSVQNKQGDIALRQIRDAAKKISDSNALLGPDQRAPEIDVSRTSALAQALVANNKDANGSTAAAIAQQIASGKLVPQIAEWNGKSYSGVIFEGRKYMLSEIPAQGAKAQPARDQNSPKIAASRAKPGAPVTTPDDAAPSASRGATGSWDDAPAKSLPAPSNRRSGVKGGTLPSLPPLVSPGRGRLNAKPPEPPTSYTPPPKVVEQPVTPEMQALIDKVSPKFEQPADIKTAEQSDRFRKQMDARAAGVATIKNAMSGSAIGAKYLRQQIDSGKITTDDLRYAVGDPSLTAAERGMIVTHLIGLNQ